MNRQRVTLLQRFLIMKYFLFFFLLLTTAPVFSQKDTSVVYYDYSGGICKEDNAVKFALIIKETDHYKKLMVDGTDNKIEWFAYFTDPECKNFDGTYKAIYKDGKTKELGLYSQNKKLGVWRSWYENGRLADSALYNNGFITGLGLTWDTSGKILDSLIFGEGGNGESYGYWNNGFPRESGPYSSGKKNGKWTYYYKTGVRCQEVNYLADSAMSYLCYDEMGNPQVKNCVYEQEASFPGGDDKWRKYLAKKLTAAKYPKEYYQGRISGIAVIQFIVDINGELQNIKVIQSVHPELDQIAMNVIRNSPKWNHAIQYNRPVKAYRRQPITFVCMPE
jgi:TonB family protein